MNEEMIYIYIILVLDMYQRAVAVRLWLPRCWYSGNAVQCWVERRNGPNSTGSRELHLIQYSGPIAAKFG